jgi:ComF family protein
MLKLKWLGIGLTADERAERERQRAEAIARRELVADLAREAQWVTDVIQRRLVELNICYHYKHVDKKGFFHPEIRPVSFRQVTATPEAHYLQVETRTMPRGVTIAQLCDPVIVEALGYSIGTEVSHKGSKEIGFWYIIPRKGRLGGIRKFVKYSDALGALPKTAPPLAYPVGFGENQKFIWDDLEEVTNLLIGGSKGGGKSNSLNMILSTFIQRVKPDDLRLFLIDMKGGMEFAFYRGIPHLGGDTPYIDPETEEEKSPLGQKIIKHGPMVLLTLEYVRNELERRARLLEGKARKLSVWNKRYRKSKLTYWVVVIDELAALMLDDRYRSKANVLLADIGARGRAVGICLVIATQVPNKDVVTRLLKGNLDTRLAFRCADGPSSQIMVDNYDATYLPRVAGRMLYCGGHHSGVDRVEVQTPYMPDDLLRDIVARVKGGQTGLTADLPTHDVTTTELFKWALENDEGRFGLHDVFAAFKKRGITYKEIQTIAQTYEQQDGEHKPGIEIEDAFYLLQPGIGPNPRRLVECGMWNENPLVGGDRDELAEATESFSEPAKTFGELVETPGDTHIEGDSDIDKWDSGEAERDSESDADSDEPADSADSSTNGRERSTLVWQPAEPVKGIKGELTNRTDALDWVTAAALWDGALRDSVKNWKYHRNETHLDLFKRILVDHFRSTWPFPDRLPDALVAVPLHPQRLAERGFNQAEVLARALANETGILLVDALTRIRHTQPQVIQRDEYRGSNVEGAFISMNDQLPPVVLLIDDLITSGATMSECARVLKGKGAQWVGGMALARPPLKASKKIQAQAKHMPPLPVPPLPVEGNSNGNQTSTSSDLMDWVDSIIERNKK